METKGEMEEVAIDIRDMEKHFGGIQAVHACSFKLPKGKISALIGPNGSGKTTMFNLITGVIGPDGGSVYYKGENIIGLKPYEIFRRGISRTFQITRIYRQMTVFENLLSVSRLTSSMREAKERADALIEFLTLERLREEFGGNLSYGQQKLLEFARALMTDPDVILLDEPAAGVNPTLLQSLLDRIHQLQEEGKTILIVEHDMNIVMNHCEKIFVMDYGEKIAEGPPDEIKDNEQVIEAYFGRK